MKITIPLPQDTNANSYTAIRHYLKQFELAIHHAQKSIDNAEREKVELSEDAFVYFNHPSLETKILDSYTEELQHIELEINLD